MTTRSWAAVLVLALLALASCQAWNKEMRHWESGNIGLPRRITLFSANGDTIAQWAGTFYIEIDSGVVSWIGPDNLERKITGTIIVEQIP